MCIKELKWTLEAEGDEYTARVLALAQVLRVQFAADDPALRAGLDRPSTFAKSDLFDIYVPLEDLKIKASLQLDANIANFKRMGMPMPNFAIDHARVSNRALEVWMCTVGGAILPKRRGDVIEIWRSLQSATPHVRGALDQIRSVEARTSAIVGERVDMFATIDDAEWLAECRHVPAEYQNEVRLVA